MFVVQLTFINCIVSSELWHIMVYYMLYIVAMALLRPARGLAPYRHLYSFPPLQRAKRDASLRLSK